MQPALSTPEIIKVDGRALFGIESPKEIPWEIFANKSDAVPRSNPDYVFDKLQLIEFRTFMSSQSIALQIIGHTGTGKSSFVEEYHARCNMPLYVVNANPRTTQADLIGEFIPSENGTLKYSYGPLLRAALEGCSCLIDEYNVMDPAEATGLNALLEGRSFYVREIDSWVHPKNGFKVIVTMNKKGAGYVGRNIQDAANDDRFSCMFSQYMNEEAEVALITSYLGKNGISKEVAQVIAKQFCQVAEQVRNLYMAQNDDADALQLTISTRSLLRWVEYYFKYKNIDKAPYFYQPIHFALERAQTLKADDTTRLAIHKFVEQVFNAPYKTPLTAEVN